MEEPWGTCVAGAVPVKNCVQKCNKRQAELACGCRDVFEPVNYQTAMHTDSSNYSNASSNSSEYRIVWQCPGG